MTKLEMLKKIEDLIDVWGGCDWSREHEDEIRDMLKKIEIEYRKSDEYTLELIRQKEETIKFHQNDLEELRKNLNNV
jgi:hypothetical protein